MPNERPPRHPLPQNYIPEGGTPYHVRDGDDWHAIARRAGVDVGALIAFNFKTRVPEEVHWYRSPK